MSSVEFPQKGAALQAVGKTVVNFQRLEHNLKLAARLGPLQGTLPKLRRDIEKRIERAATLTLGQAIQAWLDAGGEEPEELTYTHDLFDASMYMSFCWTSDPESHAAHAAALRDLLQTRNSLVHGGLVNFQWESPTECERLVEQLNGVNALIGAQIDFVGSFLKAFGSIRQEDLEAAYDEFDRKRNQEKIGAGDA
jgi:hypothetical protein